MRATAGLAWKPLPLQHNTALQPLLLHTRVQVPRSMAQLVLRAHLGRNRVGEGERGRDATSARVIAQSARRSDFTMASDAEMSATATFDTLPDALALCIFNRVPVVSRGRCSRVSRRWRQLLRSPAAWSHLDLSTEGCAKWCGTDSDEALLALLGS